MRMLRWMSSAAVTHTSADVQLRSLRVFVPAAWRERVVVLKLGVVEFL